MVQLTARCQISDESKDDEIQEESKQKKKEKKSKKSDKTLSNLASYNSNCRETSSSDSEHNERVRH